MGDKIGMQGIAIGFGLSIVTAAYRLGAISGAHLNPAVSLGMVTASRMTPGEFFSLFGSAGRGRPARCLCHLPDRLG